MGLCDRHADGCQRLLYDYIGVGAGAAASLRDKTDIKVHGWNAAGAVVNRSQKYLGTRANEDFFANAKAQVMVAVARPLLRDLQGQQRRALRRGRHHQL